MLHCDNVCVMWVLVCIFMGLAVSRGVCPVLRGVGSMVCWDGFPLESVPVGVWMLVHTGGGGICHGEVLFGGRRCAQVGVSKGVTLSRMRYGLELSSMMMSPCQCQWCAL